MVKYMISVSNTKSKLKAGGFMTTIMRSKPLRRQYLMCINRIIDQGPKNSGNIQWEDNKRVQTSSESSPSQ